MPKVVDYYFTPVSPFTYLGHERFVALANRHSASVNVKAIDLGKVFAVSGGLPLKQRSLQRQAYRLTELERWGKYLGVQINKQPAFFPVSGDLASKWILAAANGGAADTLRLTGAILRAVWAEERNIGDANTLAAIATERGLDAEALAAIAETPRHECSLRGANTGGDRSPGIRRTHPRLPR